MTTPIVDEQQLDQIAARGGWSVTPHLVSTLRLFGEFLATEAATAGAIGPGEADRIWDRHLGDSLVFTTLLQPGPMSILDVGSGVGLPGIPVAIARPDCSMQLVDRSTRRSDLAKRAARIVGMASVDVVSVDVADITTRFDVVLFRASLRLEAAASVVQNLLKPDGYGLFAVSRRSDPPEIPPAPHGMAYDLIDACHEVLDSPAWLLRMSTL
jgi:16S rRNA (guanine527-N7)-methyltransferase